ncbi:MarR family winged helix-turn-helix transcriptional regulator [Streptomyces sp. NBC_00015]|uniref:MarR family winged helix-turn-helix transcriptional regulator n=1 Tax=unclassified Streptomyces TaxID=2593676 RepID=UPI002252C390|nr:MarR family winged helix-turn-helix transcriptional regulator [Streptomyces sp. NBC_00103]MCX5372028.1 MarR family winged helix-turn-helix transcriptional regulator [Streptomyces sp. NBC_00103]
MVSDREAPSGPQEYRLGHLLRHAQANLAGKSAEALVPYGVDGREPAVLVVLANKEALSQSEAAGRLGVDRTTMAVLVDGLEDHGLVERRRSPRDRRRNIVRLTDAGLACLERAEAARRAAERRFLAPLDDRAAAAPLRAPRMLVAEKPASR